VPIYTPWQLSDRVWDLLVTHPATGSDRGGVDIRKFTRPTDPVETEIACWWFNREFRDNPPTNYPMAILNFQGYSINSQIQTRANPVRFVLPDGSILMREAPEWYDFNWQISLYDDNRRRFEDCAWDILHGVFPKAMGVRWMDIDPPNEANRPIIIQSINTSAFRSESAYRRDFIVQLQRLALFGKALQPEEVEDAKQDTILSWCANIHWKRLGDLELQTEVLVKEF